MTRRLLIDELAEVRVVQRVKYTSMADSLGLDPSTVRGWMTGKRVPKLETLGRLAGVLGFEILEVEGEMRLVRR